MKRKFMLPIAAALAACLTGASAAVAEITVFENGEQKLTIGGKSYINFTLSNTETRNGAGVVTSDVDQNGLAIDRFYLEAKYRASKVWSGRITMDVNNEQDPNPAPTGPLDRNMNVYLKYAYIEGNFRPELQLRVGLSHTPWIDYEQGLWGHRYVSKVASDLFGFDHSADYGVGLKGDVVDGMIQYWATVTNGGGYSNPNRTEGLDFNGRVTFSPREVDGLEVSGQYRNGYMGTKTGPGTGNKSSFFQAMVSYAQEDWRAGVNYMDNTTEPFASAFDVDDSVYSLWGWAKVGEYGGFGRYDHRKNENAAAVPVAAKTDHFVVGVEMWPAKGLTLALAWDYSKTKNNGNTTGAQSKSNKFGLYSEYKF